MLSRQKKDFLVCWLFNNGLSRNDKVRWEQDVLTVDRFFYTGAEPFPDSFKIRTYEYMDLSKLVHLPDNFYPEVGWSLYLNNLSKLPKVFKPKIGGSLFLDRITEIKQKFNINIRGNVYLNSLDAIDKNFTPHIQGILMLGIKKIPKNNIFLNNYKGDISLLKIKTLPEDIKINVKGNLHLPSLNRFPKKGSITVSKDIILDHPISFNNTFNIYTGRDLSLKGAERIPKKRNIRVKGKILLKDYFVKEQSDNEQLRYEHCLKNY